MSFDTQRKIALLRKQASATAHLPKVEGQSTSEYVLANFEATGFVAVPEGEYAAAVSYRHSSDPAEPNRSLYLIFADSSEVCVHYCEVQASSKAGETDAERRFEAARNIAPELFIGAGQQTWGTFDDVQAPVSFLPELIRMRDDIQRSPTMVDADAVLAQAYGLTKGLELLGVEKTIPLALYHRMQFHHARRHSDLLLKDRPQV